MFWETSARFFNLLIRGKGLVSIFSEMKKVFDSANLQIGLKGIPLKTLNFSIFVKVVCFRFSPALGSSLIGFCSISPKNSLI